MARPGRSSPGAAGTTSPGEAEAALCRPHPQQTQTARLRRWSQVGTKTPPVGGPGETDSPTLRRFARRSTQYPQRRNSADRQRPLLPAPSAADRGGSLLSARSLCLDGSRWIRRRRGHGGAYSSPPSSLWGRVAQSDGGDCPLPSGHLWLVFVRRAGYGHGSVRGLWIGEC